MTTRNTIFAGPARACARIPTVVLFVVELLVLSVVLVLGWKAWHGWPTVPLSDPDTWGYLNPALSWLSGLGFEQTDGRDWLYPTFLILFLKTTGSFTGIVAWQKFLGVIGGILMAVTWRCWVSMLPFNRWVLFLLSLLGAVPIYVQLVNQQNIFFEMSIRPEAVLSCFVYAQLACLMGYCKYRWQTPRALPSLLLGAAAIVLAYACILLKPSWYLAAAATAVPVFLGLFGKSLPLQTRLLTPALGIVASLLILWLPPKAFVIRDSASATLLPDAIFCVHARLVASSLDAKLAAMPDADPGKAKLQAFVNVLKSEIHNSEIGHRTYEKLGFDPDYLMHSDVLSAAIDNYTDKDRKKFGAFCMTSYRDAVFHNPGGFAKKIFDQFTYFLFPESKIFFTDRINLKKGYQETVAALNPNQTTAFKPEVREMYRRYVADAAVQLASTGTLGKDPKVRAFRQAFTPCILPVELLFLAALLATLIWSPLRPLRLGGWAAFMFFSAPLGNAVEVCLVHALDIYRYRATYGGFLLFALMAMAVFVCVALAQSLSPSAEKSAPPGA